MGMGSNLGGATFTLAVNSQQFTRGLQQAQQQAQQSSARMSYAFLELSRAIEDAQYGIRGVVNNIPQLAMYLGAGAGVAGAASLASVAISQLATHWDALSDAMQAAWSGSTVEQLRSIRAEADAAAEAFARLAKTPTEVQAAGKRGIEKAITEGPTGKVLEGVLNGVATDQALAAPPVDEEVKAQARMWGGRAAAEKLEAQRDEANRKKAAEILGQLGEDTDAGKAARATVRRMVEKNPGAFPKGFLADLEDNDPEQMKRQRALERQGEQNAAAMHHRLRREREDQAERERQADLEIQGRKNNKDMVKRLAREDADENRKLLNNVRDRIREEKKERGVGRQVRDIMEGVQSPRQLAQWIGGAEFARFGAQEGLNNTADIQKRQLDALERLVRLAEDNPTMKKQIMQAAVAGP